MTWLSHGAANRSSEVTRSRAYKKNDQAFVEQKNGAVVRRLMGYGRFDGVEAARVITRLYASARLYVNFFQPSFKLKEKRREGSKVIKRYHAPLTPYERVLAHPHVTLAVKQQLCDSTARSIQWHFWPRSVRPRRNSATGSIVVPEMRTANNFTGRPLRCIRCSPQHPTQLLLRRTSAGRSTPEMHVLRTEDQSGVIRREFACRPNSTRTLLRSRTGLRQSRNSPHSLSSAG